MRHKLSLITAVLGIALAISQARAADIVPIGSDWLYLNPETAADQPDANFAANWFTPGFDTSAFSGPAPGPFARSEDGVDNKIQAFTESHSRFIRPAGTLMPLPARGERATAYFVHNFTTDAPLTNLGLEYLIDDGARVYLDGNLVTSINCCFDEDRAAKPVDAPVLATDRATAVGNERTYTLIPLLPGETLAAGAHTLAIAVTQTSATSDDLAMSARVLDGYVFNTVIRPEEEWKWFEGLEDPSEGLEWTTMGFDDNDWLTGNGGFGYDTNDADPPVTVIDLVNTPLDDMQNGYSTVYFRKSFDVNDPSLYDEIQVSIDYDDAFALYINGVEVTRSGTLAADTFPIGEPIPFDSLSGSHESTNNSGAPGEVFNIDLTQFADLLTTGENSLAIQSVNQALDSSDFFMGQFNLSLIGNPDPVVGPSGDFDGNGVLDAADIDALAAAIRDGDTDSKWDLNSDGAVTSEDHRVWVEEIKNTWIGDANLDGSFGTPDFVAVFTIGEYEDGVPGNSTWAEGDWNGDGDFGTPDFVAAFGAGGFESGERPGGPNAVAAVPEPSTFGLLLIAGLALLTRRRVR